MYHTTPFTPLTDSDAEDEDDEEDAELGISLGTNQPERELALHIAQTMRDLAQVHLLSSAGFVLCCVVFVTRLVECCVLYP